MELPPIHIVDIIVDGEPKWQIDVPTYLGVEAALRRARWVIHTVKHLELDQFEVVSVGVRT